MPSERVIFIVDDDVTILDSTAALMASAGLKFATFASAEAFLTDFDPGDSGCLLLDIRLPGISGIDLANKLNNDSVDLPIILISGHATTDVAEELIGSNVVGHLEKPIDSHALIELLTSVISGS